MIRTTFTVGERDRILASAECPADRVALRLLLDYGLRKNALRGVRLEHFDRERRRLTILTKNGKYQTLPLVDPELWDDLEQVTGDYLLCRSRQIWRGYESDGSSRFERKHYPHFPMGRTALHEWWYARLEDGGLVPPGTNSGQRMHKARHSAGQRMLDATGNLKAAQALLGHADIGTTGNIYTDWNIDQLADSLREALDVR